jgi:diguanylate cyclase (GGDEF)-like protein
VRALWILILAALAVHLAHAIAGFGGPAVDRAISAWLYDGVLVGAAAVCAARAALVPRRRVPWTLLAAGMALWSTADVYWTLAVEGTPAESGVTVADAGWLSFYPACYVAVALLVRARVPRLPRSVWLDGLIAALASGAVGAALVLPPLRAAAAGASPGTLAVNLAYPVGDVMLLGIVMGVFTLTAWRPDRMWVLLGAGVAASGVADAVYLSQLSADTYVTGGVIDSLWLASSVLIAASAWQRAPRMREARRGLRTLGIPIGFALAALALETYDHVDRIDHAAMALATATLVLVLARLFLAFRDNEAMLERTHAEAMSDALTGLGNRRRLLIDLEAALEPGRDASLLAVFDLDGFKSYNDGFGHPAGDALLTRLGGKLGESVTSRGEAYRMGGDEFCILLDDRDGEAESVRARAAQALADHGLGFDVSASHGAVRLPAEAKTPAEALQVADQRLYRQKSGRAGSPRIQARDVLMRVLHEREPELHEHLRSVARLAVAVARRLGMTPEEVDEVARGAELHDIGKMAIPDGILGKPGELDDREWLFIRRHTLIGESILAAAPALVPVARLVRSSHERFDGRGYPDGLSGEEIPLGSRIVFACDAYDAMISDRPYAAAMARDDALDQIRRGRGAQFDPAVVAALCDAVHAGDTERCDPLPGVPADLDLWSPAVPDGRPAY